jgi:GNAT superfamily N-acetyltransferase
MELEFRPVTRERWPELDRLFSESAGEELGNPARCWCMEWRLERHQDWLDGAGEVNRVRMQKHIEEGFVPGLIAYLDGEPAGWISVSPRPDLVGMRSRLRHPEAADIWSIICFYVPETHRGQGMMRLLLEGAVAHAAASGARIVEGYPFVKELADDGAGGTVEAFEHAGFKRHAEIRPGQFSMRCHTHAEPQQPSS